MSSAYIRQAFSILTEGKTENMCNWGKYFRLGNRKDHFWQEYFFKCYRVFPHKFYFI